MKTTPTSFKALFGALTMLTLSAFTLVSNHANAQVLKNFTPRGTPVHKIKGDVAIIGNTNMVADDLSQANNSNNQMNYVDVDGIPNTVNSSSATLVLSSENYADPYESTIVFAGLYWTGRAHDGGNSPHEFTVNNIGTKYYNTNVFNGYMLNITHANDNSSHTSENNRRVLLILLLRMEVGI